MSTALIGHTGFVGGMLAAARRFDTTFNSRNIDMIAGEKFDTVVCAGVSAVKWLANREPEADRAAIARLTDALQTVRARRFVLISTVDVYGDPRDLTEDDAPPTEGLHPYGLHRLELESFIRDRFANHAIVRLPALFGAGLKKNALYDLMHDNMVDRIVPNARFQWYSLARLADDLDRIEAAGVPLVNVSAEPVAMSAIAERWFPRAKLAAAVADPPVYDIQTRHAALLGGQGHYHLDAATVFAALETYLRQA